MGQPDLDQVVFDYLNPRIPAGSRLVDVPLVRATDESIEGYGEIARTRDHRIEIVPWPLAGWRRLDAGTGVEGGTTEGIFACEWRGNELIGRNEAVGGHYVIGFRERPEEARKGVALAADRVLLWHCNYHPDGGQLFFPLDGKPFVVPVARPGDDLRPEDFIALWSDGSFGIYIHPGIWHEGVFPVTPAGRFFDRQGRVHARVSCDLAASSACCSTCRCRQRCSAGRSRANGHDVARDQPHDLVLEVAAAQERLLLHHRGPDGSQHGARHDEHLFLRQLRQHGAWLGGDEGRDRSHHLDGEALGKDGLHHCPARPHAAAKGIEDAAHRRADAAFDGRIGGILLRPGHLDQGRLHLLAGERQQDRVLVGEVLVERADADAGPLGDRIGGEGAQSAGFQNLSRRLQDRGHGLAGARLARDSSFASRDLSGPGHGASGQGKGEYDI
jgi:hypothetical protein